MRKKVEPAAMAALCGIVRTMVRNGTDDELAVLVQCFIDDGVLQGQRESARHPPKREGLTVVDSNTMAGRGLECGACGFEGRGKQVLPVRYFRRDWTTEDGKRMSQHVSMATCQTCQVRWVRLHDEAEAAP